jgi:hypothetical protein
VYSKEHWANKDGLIYIEGRTDDRLSIFALRIEQAETEAAALKIPGIDFAHLVVHELGEGLAPSWCWLTTWPVHPLTKGY